MFEDFASFLDMGGQGGFVWASYGICFGLLILLAAQSVFSWRKRQRELDILEQSRGRRREARPAETEQA